MEQTCKSFRQILGIDQPFGGDYTHLVRRVFFQINVLLLLAVLAGCGSGLADREFPAPVANAEEVRLRDVWADLQTEMNLDPSYPAWLKAMSWEFMPDGEVRYFYMQVQATQVGGAVPAVYQVNGGSKTWDWVKLAEPPGQVPCLPRVEELFEALDRYGFPEAYISELSPSKFYRVDLYLDPIPAKNANHKVVDLQSIRDWTDEDAARYRGNYLPFLHAAAVYPNLTESRGSFVMRYAVPEASIGGTSTEGCGAAEADLARKNEAARRSRIMPWMVEWMNGGKSAGPFAAEWEAERCGCMEGPGGFRLVELGGPSGLSHTMLEPSLAGEYWTHVAEYLGAQCDRFWIHWFFRPSNDPRSLWERLINPAGSPPPEPLPARSELNLKRLDPAIDSLEPSWICPNGAAATGPLTRSTLELLLLREDVEWWDLHLYQGGRRRFLSTDGGTEHFAWVSEQDIERMVSLGVPRELFYRL